MKEPDAVRAVHRLRDEADAATRTMGAPDVDALVEAAATRREVAEPGRASGRRAFGFVPAIAAAAAVAVVLSLRLLVPWGPAAATNADPPEHLVTFVETLYDDSSYVIDEIAGRLTDVSQPDDGASVYLDGVWTDVLDELAAPDD